MLSKDGLNLTSVGHPHLDKRRDITGDRLYVLETYCQIPVEDRVVVSDCVTEVDEVSHSIVCIVPP